MRKYTPNRCDMANATGSFVVRRSVVPERGMDSYRLLWMRNTELYTENCGNKRFYSHYDFPWNRPNLRLNVLAGRSDP
jgi:hypothetical protein